MVAKIVITKKALQYIEKMSKDDKDFIKTIVQGAVVINVLEKIVNQSKVKGVN